jgi:hypothetical protein
MKPRHHLYLDETLTQQLATLAAKPGTSKSAIVADALRAYFGRRGAKELDDLLKMRMDRVTQQLSRLERDQKVLVETLALFIRHQLVVSPPLPEAELASAGARAEARFQAFITQVGRQLGAAKTARERLGSLAAAGEVATDLAHPTQAVHAGPERSVA